MALAGQKIGLLGGSFDPPHSGHVHITRRAIRRFGLDQVWWIVSPGNPLKQDAPASLVRRMIACRELADHPKILVTDIEARLGSRYTANTLRRVKSLYPGVNFVWLMGADNLASFHHWEDWGKIMETMPIGVLSRPGDQIAAGTSPAARRYARFRWPESASRVLASRPAPAWTLLSGPMVEQSSTEIRKSGAWKR